MDDKKTVLIVDDIPSNSKMTVEVLRSDYDIIVATNGKDSIREDVTTATAGLQRGWKLSRDFADRLRQADED